MEEKIKRLQRQKQAKTSEVVGAEAPPVSAAALRKEQLLEKKKMIELKLKQLTQKK